MSFFEFSGPVSRLSIRVQLYQVGVPSLDFQNLSQSQNQTDVGNLAKNTRSDEISFEWNQKVGEATGRTHRLFTLTENDVLPDHLKHFEKGPNLSDINRGVPRNDKEMSCNNDYVVFRKSTVTRELENEKEMYILANLGPMDIIDPRNIELLARIRLKESSNRLKIDPLIDSVKGMKMETKFGDFIVKIKLLDKMSGTENENELELEDGLKRRSNRPSITSIPESETFAVARDGYVESTVLVNLVKATNFMFNEGVTIDYKIRLPAGIKIKSKNKTGRTQRFSANDENDDFNLSEVIEFVFEHRNSDEKHQLPLLMLRLFSVDYWGRQYIAGYGSTYISLIPGRNRSKIHCWRPVTTNSLYEQFLGQSIDVDYYGVNEKDRSNRVGANCESSGEIVVETSCVAQSRQFMARDILYQLKYGSKMADMGLRSDFYQRIIKVLMDFEEARAKLLLARAIKKKI